MYGPPATSTTTGRSRWHAALLSCLCALALAALAYFHSAQVFNPYSFWLWPAFILCAAWAWRAWWRSAIGLLHWDGERWFWSLGGEAQPCRLRLHWDLQACVLVRLEGEQLGAQWLFLECAGPTRGDRLRWQALRRALAMAHVEFTEPKPGDGLEAIP